jgi:hypothetical protein
MAGQLSAEIMRKALNRLDELIDEPLTLLVGGGGAMILAHGFPLATSDMDAIPKPLGRQLGPQIQQIAQELKLPADWLNPYFSTFTHTLPSDYNNRLIEVFKGKHLKAQALGKEEMLIMKCFAGRQKDINHARALIKKKADLDFVMTHLESLLEKGIPGTQKALDFLDELMD